MSTYAISRQEMQLTILALMELTKEKSKMMRKKWCLFNQ